MSFAVRAQFKPRNGLGRFTETFITPAVAAAVTASLEHVQALAQGYCPVDTGALRESITIEPLKDSGKTISGSVAPHTDYATYVEYGTGQRGDPTSPYGHTDKPGQAAQPYMRPALDESRPAILDIFKGQISEALKS